MSEIKCISCKGENFRQGYYDVDVDVSIYSTAHNKVRSNARSYGGVESYNIDVDVNVQTDIHHDEINSNGEIGLRIITEDKSRYSLDDYSEVHKYICEDCGFIMSFTTEKKVESKTQYRKRKEKENSYDWTNFGK